MDKEVERQVEALLLRRKVLQNEIRLVESQLKELSKNYNLKITLD